MELLRISKRLVAGALVAALALPLVGCGGLENLAKDQEDETGASSSPSTVSAYVSNTAQSTEPAFEEGKAVAIEGLRGYYDDTSDDKNVTVMIYMIGSDLETYAGAASDDLKEMLKSRLGDNINVVIETGGAEQWHFSQEVDTYAPQRWVVNGTVLKHVGEGAEQSMTDPSSLSDFINWAKTAYPADRNILILWDHGGGTEEGFGADEQYTDVDSLSLAGLRQALVDGGVQFNILGFDACLMGTIETAYAAEPMADYLIASEEYEPGYGWDYTDFLSTLSDNPAVSTEELGKIVVDDYIDQNSSNGAGELTLSLIDLREIPYTYACLGNYLANVKGDIEIDNSSFDKISQARSSAKEFCYGEIDQIDIIDMVSVTDYEGADELTEAVRSCVKYQGSADITGANGLAMYFPYDNIESYQPTTQTLSKIGFTSPLEFYDYFVKVMGNSNISSGNTSTGSTSTAPSGSGSTGSGSSQTVNENWGDLLIELLGGGSGSAYESDQGYMPDDSFSYEETPVTNSNGELTLTHTSEGYELALSDSDWEKISDIAIMAALYNDKGVYLLGSDDAVPYSSSMNPLITIGGAWMGIDGHPVSFFNHTYEYRDGAYYYSGAVPALLNGKTAITIEIAWPLLDESGHSVDGSPETAYVLGYRVDGENPNLLGRGYHSFVKGDKIEFVFAEYDDEGDYVKDTVLGDAYEVSAQDKMRFDYVDLSVLDGDVACWGVVTDLYHNTVYTETVWE